MLSTNLTCLDGGVLLRLINGAKRKSINYESTDLILNFVMSNYCDARRNAEKCGSDYKSMDELRKKYYEARTFIREMLKVSPNYIIERIEHPSFRSLAWKSYFYEMIYIAADEKLSEKTIEFLETLGEKLPYLMDNFDDMLYAAILGKCNEREKSNFMGAPVYYFSKRDRAGKKLPWRSKYYFNTGMYLIDTPSAIARQLALGVYKFYNYSMCPWKRNDEQNDFELPFYQAIASAAAREETCRNIIYDLYSLKNCKSRKFNDIAIQLCSYPELPVELMKRAGTVFPNYVLQNPNLPNKVRKDLLR